MARRQISQAHWDVIQAQTGKSFEELKQYALQQPRNSDVYFRPDSIDKVFCVDEGVDVRSLQKLIRLLKKLNCIRTVDWFDSPPAQTPQNPYAGTASNGVVPILDSQNASSIPNKALALRVVNPVEQSRIVKNISGIYVLYRQKGDHTGPSLEWLVIDRSQNEGEVSAYWMTAKRRIYMGSIYKSVNAAHVTFYRPHNVRGFSCRQMMLNVPSGDMGETRFDYLSGTLTRTKSSDAYPMTSDFIIERVDQKTEHIDKLAKGAATYFDKRRLGEIDDTAEDHYETFRTQVGVPYYVPDLAESFTVTSDRDWLIAELRPAIETCSPNQLKEKLAMGRRSA